MIRSALRVSLALVVASLTAHGALAQPVKCSGAGFDDLDFWIGDWVVRWTAADGREVRGSNRVRRILDGCVIVEEFDAAPGGPLKGMSVSSYDARRRLWRQTWVDNQAGYLDFEGGRVDDGGSARAVLARSTVVNGQPVRQRMVFRDITAAGFVWDWQRSRDDGATWETTWSLRYARRTPE